jgi:hypothetical protein
MVLPRDSLSWLVYKIGLSMFTKLQRATISFVIHPSVPTARSAEWNNSAPTGRIFVKFDVRIFVQKIRFCSTVHPVVHR